MGASSASLAAVASTRRWSNAVRSGWKPDASSTAPTWRTGSRSSSYRRPSNVAVPLVGATSLGGSGSLPAPTGDWLTSHNGDIAGITAIGGRTAVPDQELQQAAAAATQ